MNLSTTAGKWFFAAAMSGISAVALAQTQAAPNDPPPPAPNQSAKDPVPPATDTSEPTRSGKQEPSSKIKGTSNDTAIFVNGVLTVPGARADTETAPSNVSARNAASDKLSIAAFRLKHLTDEQLREIAKLVGKERHAAIGGAGAAGSYSVGSEVPAPVALQELAPVPDAVTAKFPELAGTGYMRAGGKLLLVDLDDSLVVGVLEAGQ
jgi:hypothetical protein